MIADISGYAHPLYAEALAAYGTPRRLPRCEGTILIRPIPSSSSSDAMGCYPIFACQDWRELAADLSSLPAPLVSLVLVADPFGNHSPDLLRACFPDCLIPFKSHFVIDLSRTWPDYVASHHQRNARKALAAVQVEHSEAPLAWLEEWTALYACLVERHAIRGLITFSPDSFARQLAVPGIHAFRARAGGRTVGMTLWYVQNGVGYYHLAAYTTQGYALRASCALFWQAIPFFQARPGLRWLSLGAGAGLRGDTEDGLTRFKRGWSTGARPAYLCGRIFDPDAYRQLTAARGLSPQAPFFPAYRLGEW